MLLRQQLMLLVGASIFVCGVILGMSISVTFTTHRGAGDVEVDQSVHHQTVNQQIVNVVMPALTQERSKQSTQERPKEKKGSADEMIAREIAQMHVPLAPRPITPYAAVEQQLLDSKEEPLVCVVLPSFNVAPYIDQSIRSIMQQTYKNIELIVVDDASNDGTQKVIDRWKARDARIRAIKMHFGSLGGVGQPTNLGIDKCKGKYLALVDGDDLVHVEMYRQMVAKAERLKLDIALSSFGLFENTPEKLEVQRTYDAEHWNGVIKHCVATANGTEGVIGPTECGRLFRVSPVPWRKLYNLEWLNRNRLRFPEGDYVHEDNTFHWQTTMSASRIGVIDQVFAFHRVRRKGQTTYSVRKREAASAAARASKETGDGVSLSGYFSNINRIAKMLFHTKDRRHPVIILEFFKWVLRSRWFLRLPQSEKMQQKFEAIFYETINRWFNRSPMWFMHSEASTQVRDWIKNAKYDPKKWETDITIVIPCRDAKDNVVAVLDYLAQQRVLVDEDGHAVGQNRHVRMNRSEPFGKFEIILVDDHSTDGLYDAIKRFDTCANFYYIQHSGMPGAGRARNVAIPLVQGKYTYFLDADDSFDVRALWTAWVLASRYRIDLMFMPYNISVSGVKKPMFPADERLWLKRKATTAEHKEAAYQLINYPWNRIIRTHVLLAGDIFFGATVVHNDIQYHWDSITQAVTVAFFWRPVCLHRKSPKMKQVTNIATKERMTVVDSILFTDRVLRRKGFYKRPDHLKIWFKFVKYIFAWARDRVPAESMREYDRRTGALLAHFAQRSPEGFEKK